MATYSDKYLFEFETRSGTATANQLQKISTNAAAAAQAISALASAFNTLNTAIGRTPAGMGLESLKRVQVVNATGAGQQIAVSQQMNSTTTARTASTASVVARAETEAEAAVQQVQSKYLRTNSQRIADYTKFWLIGYGINQIVMTASAAMEQWASSQNLMSSITADFGVSLRTTGDEAQRYTEKVLAISRATGISISEVGPGLVIQERVRGAPADLTQRAAEVQRVTGADNYSVERDLLSLSKQFPDESMISILDAFTGAMRRSSLSASEFFNLLESSGPLARQFNTSMETVFGVFAGLSTATGETGQSIELFMRQMERVYTSADTRAAVEKNIGPVSYTDPATGYEVRRPWDEIMTEISKLSKQAQDEIAGTIPNMLGQQTRQIFLAMMKDWQSGITDAIGGAKNATGEFERSVGIMSDTWAAKTQSMKTAWESFLATVGGSGAVLKFVSDITRDLNYSTMTNVAKPYVDKYENALYEPRQQAAMREERGEEPGALAKFDAANLTPDELYRRDTGLEPRQMVFTGVMGNAWQNMATPEYLKWIPENLDKYTKQLQGDTTPAAQTEWQKRTVEAERINGLIERNGGTTKLTASSMPDSAMAGVVAAIEQGFRLADERRQFVAPPAPGMPSALAGRGLATTYLDEQKLTLDKGVTPQEVLAEVNKLRAERIASMRALEQPDATTGRMIKPYADAAKTPDEMLLKIAGGLDTKSPLLLQDEAGNPLQGIIENADFTAIAIKNLGDAASDKKLTLDKGVTPQDVLAEVNRLRAERITSMRAFEQPDPATGKMVRPYADVAKTPDETLLKMAGGLDAKSPMILRDESGNPLQGIIENADLTAIAIKNLGDAANDKARNISSGVSSSQWYEGGTGKKVMAEYDRLVKSEIQTARKNKPELAGMDDSAVKAAIGISKDYIEVTSTVGTTLQTVSGDAAMFEAAVRNVGSAMAKLSYFDQPEWMGESDYVRRLNQYSKSNLDIQMREGTYQDPAAWQRYVGPSGKAYDVYGNQESLGQGVRGIAGDDKRHQESITAANKSNALLEKINNSIKSMVGELLQPTTVTVGDMAAANTGSYKDKWDEPVRRVQDVVDRMQANNPNKGPWQGYAESLGIDTQNKDTAMASAEEFKRKFYNGLMSPEFYEVNSKEGFLTAARTKMEEQQGQSRLQKQAMGWMKEAGISDDMAKMISREMTNDVSPMESYWRGGKTDKELASDMAKVGKGSSAGVTAGVKEGFSDAKPTTIFTDAWKLQEKDTQDLLKGIGKSIGGTIVDGMADQIRDRILPSVKAAVEAAILNEKPTGNKE